MINRANQAIKLSKIPKLFYKKTLYFINNFNEYDVLSLSKVIKYQKIITDITEQVSITNIFLNKNCNGNNSNGNSASTNTSNTNEGNYKELKQFKPIKQQFKHIKLRRLENIIIRLYSEVSLFSKIVLAIEK